MYSVSSGCVLTWLGLIHFLYAMMNDVDDDDVLLLLVLVLHLNQGITSVNFNSIWLLNFYFHSIVVWYVCMCKLCMSVCSSVCLFVCLQTSFLLFANASLHYSTFRAWLGFGLKVCFIPFCPLQNHPIVMIIIEGSKCKFFLPSSCSFALFFQLLLLFFPSIGLQFRFVAIFTPFYHCVCPFFLFSHE